jgi:Bax inhibitor 1
MSNFRANHRNQGLFVNRSFDFSTLFSFKDISPKTQSHLTRVYTMLMACSLVCAFGMWVNTATFIHGFFMNLLSIILSVYLIYQVSNRSNSEETRMMFLGAFAFQLGFLVGPAMHLFMDIQPKLVYQALLYTACAFTSFSAISLFCKRRSMLFLGGIIATMVQCMILYRLMGWLTGWATFGLPYMMISLFIACLYIIYDTQVIVERAERGDKDVPTHTMMLFIDLFELFIRILQILMELNKDKDDDRRRRR